MKAGQVAHLLLSFIPRAPSRIDTPRLAQLLAGEGVERTPRSVQRQLRGLEGAWPIRCLDGSKPYQWQWLEEAPTYEFPPLSAHEAMLLRLAHAYLRDLVPGSASEYLERRLKIARSVLASGGPIATWAEKVAVVPRGPRLISPTVKPMVLRKVHQALLTDRRLACRYRKRDSEEVHDLVVSPLAVVARGPLLYVVARTENDEVRHLALHRFESADVLNAPATRPDSFDLVDHVNSGALGFRLGAPVRLTARLDDVGLRTLEETPLADDQTLTGRSPDGALVRGTVPFTVELVSWLVSYAPHVEVLKPTKLRREVVRRIEAAATCYGVLGREP